VTKRNGSGTKKSVAKKKEEKLHEDAEAGAARLSGFWSSGRPSKWQRNRCTHSAGHGVQCNSG